MWLHYVNKDGRQMVAGSGRSGNESANGSSPIGQYRQNYDAGATSANNVITMVTVVGD
jgi:hypothetical protein